MGVTTNGQLCYGVLFGEGFEFPWDDFDDGDHEAWWRWENGFQETWDGKEESWKAYNESKRSFEEKNPVPFDLVNYCSGECPMYILAVPGSSFYNSRGTPLEIAPEDMIPEKSEVESLKAFINKYLADAELSEEEMLFKWYLSSYWG